jgi:hypothetical protein
MTAATYLYFLAGGFLFALLSLGLGHLEGGSSEHLVHGGEHSGGEFAVDHAAGDVPGGHAVTVGHGVGHGGEPPQGAAIHMSHAPFGMLSGALRTTAWFISPLGVAAFALLFGGTGAVLSGALPASANVITFVLASAMGAVGFAGVKALMTLFVRSSSAPLSLDALGSEGTLVFGVQVNEKGEQLAGQVQYLLEGVWRTTLAHTESHGPLQRGTKVRIVGHDPARGVVLVEAIDPLDELPATREALPASRP